MGDGASAMIATETRDLLIGETYLLAVLTPPSWTAADVVSTLSTKPPGLSPGTFQVLTIASGDTSGQFSSFHVTGKWFGPKMTIPDGAGSLLYPVLLHLDTSAGDPLPVSTSAVLWPPDGYQDVPNRVLSTGLHYVFVILAPSTTTEDDAMAELQKAGWDLKSFSNPPSAVTKELQALYAKGFTTVPQAWLVNAYWGGTDGSLLPNAYGTTRFVALAVEIPVPFGPPAPPPGSEPSPTTTSWGTVLFTAAAGVVILGGLYLARRRLPHPPHRA